MTFDFRQTKEPPTPDLSQGAGTTRAVGSPTIWEEVWVSHRWKPLHQPFTAEKKSQQRPLADLLQCPQRPPAKPSNPPTILRKRPCKDEKQRLERIVKLSWPDRASPIGTVFLLPARDAAGDQHKASLGDGHFAVGGINSNGLKGTGLIFR